MKIISQETKNAFKQPTTKRKGVIQVNNQYYDIYNVEYYADCYDEGKVIGNAIASQLDFDIPYMEKFDTFQYYDCIWVGNNYEFIDYGTFTVFDEKDQDEFNKHITAFDNLIKFNKKFENVGGYPKTLYNELLNVCNQAEVTLGNNSIPNGTFIVENNQFTSGENLKTVLKQICAISGTYAIVKNNILYLQLKNITNETIDKSQHEPVDWKRKSYGINQVIIGDSQIEGEYVIKQDDEDIALNGVHKLEIKDNLFAYTQAKRSALINELYNQVHGFGYIPYETKGEWLSYLEIGDTITIDDTETILLRVNAKSPNSLETIISAPAIIDSSIEYVDNTDDVENRLKLTERSVDKQKQIITDVVSEVSEQNSKISYVTQTVDEINQKISDISDITVSGESDIGDVLLDNVNESEPLAIKVRPLNGNNISYLYPNSNLFPSSTTYLKVRKIRFIRTYIKEGQTLTENIDYELPDDLLYYDSTHYDEFYLDYDSQTCQITKRCKYNADGTVGLLTSEIINTYTYPSIPLGTGDYEVKLLGYDVGYLYVQLMASNIYTTQYVTKVELNSAIRQTATEITTEVSETYTTKAESNTLSSRISQTAKSITLTVNNGSTSSGITITTTKEDGSTDTVSGTITMTGLVKFADLSGSGTTTINGANITTGIIKGITIQSTNYSANSSGMKIDLSNGSINSKNFKVDSNGNVTVSGIINASSGTFNGTVNASSGTFNGSIYSSSGTIGGWTINSNKLGGNNTYLNPNGACQFYPSGGAIVGWNDAIRLKGPSGIAIYNSYTDYSGGTTINNGVHLMADAGNLDLMQYSSSYGVNIRSYCSPSTKGNASARSIMIAAGNNITLFSYSGGVYAQGNGKSNALVRTDQGSASSISTKTNIEKFKDIDYKTALELLKNIDIYSYDYKYKLYDKKHQYGFIIDEIEKQKDYDKFFDFRVDKAKVNKDKTLDFDTTDINKEDEIIEVKKYDSDVLDKYLLTVCKALLYKIDELERKII